MAKDVKREAAKAVMKLGRQADRRRSIGHLRDEVRKQATYAQGCAYDLNGAPH